MITSAFTCTGPYAVLIMLGIKRVENRSAMPAPEKGRCGVGCSKSFCKEEYGNFVQWVSRALPSEDFERIPAWGDVKDWPGKIVGACDYEARPRGSEALPWDEGYAYWWDLSEVVCFDEPIPCRGNVGMWQMSPELAARVTAADELARIVGMKIASVEDAVRVFRIALPAVGGREGFFVLPLDASRRVLSAPVLVSLGADHGTAVVNAGEVFREALKAGAEAVIVAHNHPSGNPSPSMEDLKLTAELRSTANLLGVQLLDHLILGSSDYVDGQGVISIAERKG